MIRVGCCGFPVGKAKYYDNFEVVEIQQTFYQLPDKKLAEKWRREAPEEFEFTVKAPQLITHPPESPTYRRLKEKIPGTKKKNYGFFKPTKEVLEVLERTIEICQALNSKVLLFQSPSSFKKTAENRSNLKEFITAFRKLGSGIKFVWEQRSDWSDEDVKSLLSEIDGIECVDPLVRKPACGDINYFRLHGAYKGSKIIYNYSYTDSELKRILDSCNKKLNYVMFNNISMFEDALRFIKRCKGG